MPPTERDYMLRVRMTGEEHRMLLKLSDAAGLTASDVVRQLIRREYAATPPRATPTPKHRKR